MNIMRFVKPLSVLVLVAVLAAAGYFFRGVWLPWVQHVQPTESLAPIEEASTPSDTIIVGDQAQKNLNLTAKSIKADVFWKTITVPGMVVDRPGVSDREIVAPAIGTVSEIRHSPGDTVRPDEVLFILKLSSDALHETQTNLLKATQDIALAQARLERLTAAGDGIPRSRLIEIESDIKRLEAVAKSSREYLLLRGLSPDHIEGVARGQLVSEISIRVPRQSSSPKPLVSIAPQPDSTPLNTAPLTYELQELKVEGGQQVEVGQTLCLLSNHQSLAIEGRAFRDETSLLERSVKEGWSVEVDFQEDAEAGWPSVERTFHIHHIANTIDPVTRTFAFLMLLDNQSKAVVHKNGTQLLWRCRPGQKVRLYIRAERLDNVFVLPADAVVREGPEAFVFTQNVNIFERKGVHVLFQDRDQVVIANDGSLSVYSKGPDTWTIPAIVQTAAAQLNRMTKSGSGGVPKGFHIHADGSLHKNEDEGK